MRLTAPGNVAFGRQLALACAISLAMISMTADTRAQGSFLFGGQDSSRPATSPPKTGTPYPGTLPPALPPTATQQRIPSRRAVPPALDPEDSGGAQARSSATQGNGRISQNETLTYITDKIEEHWPRPYSLDCMRFTYERITVEWRLPILTFSTHSIAHPITGCESDPKRSYTRRKVVSVDLSRDLRSLKVSNGHFSAECSLNCMNVWVYYNGVLTSNFDSHSSLRFGGILSLGVSVADRRLTKALHNLYSYIPAKPRDLFDD